MRTRNAMPAEYVTPKRKA